MEQDTARSGPLRKLPRVCLSLLFLLMGLSTVELLVRGFKGGGEAREDAVQASYMPLRLRPDFEGLVMGQPIRTNQYGFRDRDRYPVEAPERELRVLGLGDSVAFGFGLSEDETFLEITEERLNESSPSFVRVINAAGQGYSPSSYHAYLVHEGLAFRPDLVIVQIELCNDVPDEALLRGPIPAADDPAPRVRGGRYVVSWDGNLLGSATQGPYFFEKTYTYTMLLRRTLTRLRDWFPGYSVTDQPGSTFFHIGFDRILLRKATIEQGWRRLFGALHAVRQVLDARQIPLLLVLLPSRYVFQDAAGARQEFSRGLLERAESMARQRRIPALRLDPLLASQGGESLYFDFAHLTAAGNRLIGEALANHVTGAGLLQP